ncbi:hypothetical protein P171DRAFT_434298 [Karstenula rhodostoma CBS 690.94]|uniref:Uncharacterized protein n=1 Tax=Karstenula rhodostoma CBS 690.94 TaxID=1392251 RepID=A0A9P4PCY2_9PLEO|nr:hypothetical protein P171DRAFT_434298 [Karstenula rhodostoma CBS 690.94]
MLPFVCTCVRHCPATSLRPMTALTPAIDLPPTSTGVRVPGPSSPRTKNHPVQSTSHIPRTATTSLFVLSRSPFPLKQTSSSPASALASSTQHSSRTLIPAFVATPTHASQ